MLASVGLNAQDVAGKFNEAVTRFATENIFKHASIGLLVINSKTGKIITNLNAEKGLAPASCQKVITAATAFEILGHNFTYETGLGVRGTVVNGVLLGDVIIKGSGDPTLGSWRYKETGEEVIITEFKKALSQEGINEITGHVYVDETLWQGETIPGGWIWEDLGNYYGAGAQAVNWRENQYDLVLKSGSKIGDTVVCVGTKPGIVSGLHLNILATAAKMGSGDNTYIYMPLFAKNSVLRGTIPVNENAFVISGSMPQPAMQLAITLESSMKKNNSETADADYRVNQINPQTVKIIYRHNSPPLDSIIFWFLKRSINLYGEALIKTLAYNLTKKGDTDSGVAVIKSFWEKQGIDGASLNIIDGSGLSPANRVTPSALVQVVQFAKKQSWFNSFYNALPEINGIKMKSGSIGGVVSYTGFIAAKSGGDYAFSFIINNYAGDANDVRKKMWALLDLLK
jgi:serine-type D-Ala-D-Ala carboxypeptidase/endopeptidase (penicillin-binding protein 4)